MKYLIFGLGNPGTEYEQTRHNIGFEVLDFLAKDQVWKPTNFGLRCEVKHRGRTLILIKPDTFMNLSGTAVKFWVAKEKIQLKNMLVIADELALPLGSLRLKGKGSDAGHNGHKSIIQELGTSQYPRLRFGIGNEFAKGKQVNFVLGKWEPEEEDLVKKGIERSAEAIRRYTFNGPSDAMVYCNTK